MKTPLMKNIDVANLQQRDLNNIILVILLFVLLFTWYTWRAGGIK